jgi:hypothetical protein
VRIDGVGYVGTPDRRSILSRLDRNFTELEVRRAFTVYQLMTILEENHHSFLIVEHDPLLYEDAGEMEEYLAQALKKAEAKMSGAQRTLKAYS